jgi:hypothetical protein
VGVVRRPTGWFRSVVDENRLALGPPPALLDEFKRRKQAFELRGMCDEGAHNAAWNDVGFADRYRTHLDESEAAREAVVELAARLRAGESLVLVCYENPGQKRCHRTLLRDRVVAQLSTF